jgi:hypothetical protein
MHQALENYYVSQAQNGVAQYGSGIPVFKGRPWHQTGGSFFGLIKRFGIPLLKYLGRSAAQSAVGIGADVLAGQSFKDSAKARLRESTQQIGADAIGKAQTFLERQKGAGLRRKRITRKKPVKKTKLSDIFGKIA